MNLAPAARKPAVLRHPNYVLVLRLLCQIYRGISCLRGPIERRPQTSGKLRAVCVLHSTYNRHEPRQPSQPKALGIHLNSDLQFRCPRATAEQAPALAVIPTALAALLPVPTRESRTQPGSCTWGKWDFARASCARSWSGTCACRAEQPCRWRQCPRGRWRSSPQ